MGHHLMADAATPGKATAPLAEQSKGKTSFFEKKEAKKLHPFISMGPLRRPA